jgi:hypothetical protein
MHAIRPLPKIRERYKPPTRCDESSRVGDILAVFLRRKSGCKRSPRSLLTSARDKILARLLLPGCNYFLQNLRQDVLGKGPQVLSKLHNREPRCHFHLKQPKRLCLRMCPICDGEVWFRADGCGVSRMALA